MPVAPSGRGRSGHARGLSPATARRAVAESSRLRDGFSTNVALRAAGATVGGVPRLPRAALPATGVYHVTTRGVARAAIARDDEDARLFLVLVAEVSRRERWNCHAFCLMPNHHHLIVAAELVRLSRGMQRLNGVYAERFNERHRRSGHLFGDRFAAWTIRDDDHLRDAAEYVLQNPVRAGLCDRPEEWPWSGRRTSILAR